MPNSFIQPSFAAGELAPGLAGRVDLAKYRVGARTMRNFVSRVSGGASTRAGTLFVGRAANDGSAVRLIPFSFSASQTYILVFSHLRVDVISNGGFVVDASLPLTTPWAAADLAQLKYAQSADVLTICHPSYPPYDLKRSGAGTWSLAAISFQAKVQPPSGGAAAHIGGGTGFDYHYVVTSVTDSPAEESVPSAAIDVSNKGALNQTTGVANTLGFDPPASGPTPNRYRIYRSSQLTTGLNWSGTYGYIGESTTGKFQDVNYAPDFSDTPPVHDNPFATTNPACVTYYEGRKIFAGGNDYPDTIWMTKPGNYTNMDTSSPGKDDDAITVTLAAQQVNPIRHLVSINSLLALTQSGAWMISPGGTANALTPSSVTAKPQAYNGCNDVPPLTVNYDVLYIQSKGSTVRDLAYNYYVNIFTGDDKSVLSSHLFYGYQITDWAWCEEPFKIIWCVRSDGILLAFSYLKEQDVYAWTRHDTAGLVKSVASISEGSENALYLVVQRTVPGVNGGAPVQYIERLQSRNFMTNGVADATKVWCVDCGLQYAGAPATTISGLGHLEGLMVTGVADGGVVAPQRVSGGAITLPAAASLVTLGLGYSCQLQPMRLDVGEPTIQGKRKKVGAVTLVVEDTRGLKVGPSADRLTEIKQWSPASGASVTAPPLVSGQQRVVLDPLWQTDGSVLIQQDYPLPATVLAIIPEVEIGDR